MKKKTMTTRTVEGYMCKIDFDCELGKAPVGSVVYPDVDDLKSNHDCWKSCGIVKVSVSYIETIVEQDLNYEGE